MQSFFCAEGSAPKPLYLQRQQGVLPPGPQTILPLQISGYAPGVYIAVVILWKLILRLAGVYGVP